MADQAASALGNPTRYGHYASVEGLGLTGITHGVTNNFNVGVDSLGFTGMTTGTDYGNNYNTGLTANISITKQFAQRIDDKFGMDHCGYEQLLFISTRPNSKGAFACDHYMLGLSAFNAYLRSQEGKHKYSSEASYRKIFEDWQFIGTQKSKDDSLVAWRNERFTNIITGGRAEIPDLTRAQVSGKDKRGTANECDVTWLLCVKREENHPTLPTKQTYWTIQIYTARNKEEPSPVLYSGYADSKPWVGKPIRVGPISIVQGNRSYVPEFTNRARDAIEYKSDNRPALIKSLALLPRIDLLVGIQ